jgi:hypothetical protein
VFPLLSHSLPRDRSKRTLFSQASLAFLHQFRLQRTGVLKTCANLHDLLLPRALLETGSPTYVALGFGNTIALEKHLEGHERLVEKLRLAGEEDHDTGWVWQRMDQSALQARLRTALRPIGGFNKNRCSELSFIVE